MPYRITKDAETVLDLRDRQPFRLDGTHYPANHLQRGGVVDGYEVEHYEPEPPAPYVPDPASIALTRATFFMAVDALAGLTPGDPIPKAWLVEQIKASTLLNPAEKRKALIYLEEASAFERSNEFMDVLGPAILGVTAEELDQAFLDAAQQSATAP